jgi:hypothetical protein
MAGVRPDPGDFEGGMLALGEGLGGGTAFCATGTPQMAQIGYGEALATAAFVGFHHYQPVLESPRWGCHEMKRDYRIGLFALIALALWLFFAVPAIYAPERATGFWGWLSKDASGLFTSLTFLVGAAQLVFFWYQLRLIRVSLDDAKAASRAAAEAATASVRQANLAEQTFAKIERPYLFVAEIGRCDVEETPEADEFYHAISVTFSVANQGKIPAIISSVKAGLYVAPHPEEPVNVDHWHPLIASPILAPGEVRKGLSEWMGWDDNVSNDEDGTLYPNLNPAD